MLLHPVIITVLCITTCIVFYNIQYNATIDNVCVPNGLETPVKLFSYPSLYGAPIHGDFC